MYDNTGNRIGVVKIELPNCKVEDGEIVVMGFDNRKKEEGITITKPFHFAEIDKIKFGKI